MISEEREKASFQLLTNQLKDYWKQNGNCQDKDILVIPSISLCSQDAEKIEEISSFEERLLFYLVKLLDSEIRLVYVTSRPLSSCIINYYLKLLLKTSFSEVNERLIFLSTQEYSKKTLTQKILDDDNVLEQISKVLSAKKSYMVCYNSTFLERKLSVKLNLPLLALDPELLYWGTKSGSRQIFQECNLPHPDGSELVWNTNSLAVKTAELWNRQPQLDKIIIKLNEGFSGLGNIIIDLKPIKKIFLDSISFNEKVTLIYNHFSQFFANNNLQTESFVNFSSQISRFGAIAEAFIEAEVKKSSSVQGYIDPNGKVQIISTHDQMLGGLHNQIYLGCIFPADREYCLRLHRLGLKVGQSLAKKGVCEHFCVDFVASRKINSSWNIQAVEINLRKEGTTHPFMILKHLTNGQYNLSNGLFCSQKNSLKYYISSDKVKKSQYKSLPENELIHLIEQHNLNFDFVSETGIFIHLIGSLSEFGNIGITCIGNSPAQAKEFYERIIQVLDDYTRI